MFGDRYRILAGNLFGHKDSLLETSVRQRKTGHDVADRVHTVHGRTEAFVGDDKSLVEADSVFFETVTVRARSAADGEPSPKMFRATQPELAPGVQVWAPTRGSMFGLEK